MPVLDVKDISIAFGGLKAVTNFELQLKKGELVGLIGPNGAGKTTVFNILTGVYLPSYGEIVLRHDPDIHDAVLNLVGTRPHKITQMGIARTFQNIRLFKGMTVLENVLIAHHFNVKYNAFHAILRLPAYRKGEDAVRSEAMELLKIFNLESKANEIAESLPYGEQRKLEIARALATNPKVLLLDEPAAGMNPQETQELMHLIRGIRDKFNLTILLIEHDMHLVMNVCERILVLDHGQIIAKGTPGEIAANPEVIRAYLGEGGGADADA